MNGRGSVPDIYYSITHSHNNSYAKLIAPSDETMNASDETRMDNQLEALL